MTRRVPPSASVATPGQGAQLVAPAAERNRDAICDLLVQVAPRTGHALELASGTGQHMAAFATLLPDLQWQPSEVAEDRRASIDAYCDRLSNVAPAMHLDATRPGWGDRHAGLDLIILINLLHLISEAECTCLIREAALALAPRGRLLIYGPFMRDGDFTSKGDQRFHTSLVTSDPSIGYKNDRDVLDLMTTAELVLSDPVDMPANNLVLLAEKPA